MFGPTTAMLQTVSTRMSAITARTLPSGTPSGGFASTNQTAQTRKDRLGRRPRQFPTSAGGRASAAAPAARGRVMLGEVDHRKEPRIRINAVFDVGVPACYHSPIAF